MSKASWGLKRHCPSCGNRFYDLGKNPVACVKCKFMHDITVQAKPRRSRAKPAPAPKAVVVKKPVKAIEGVPIREFEAVMPDNEDAIEEIEEIEDIEPLEEMEEIEEDDEEISMEAGKVGGKTLIDDVKDEEESEAEEEEDKAGKAKGKKAPAKEKPKKKK